MTDMARTVLDTLRRTPRVESVVLEFENMEKIRVGLKIGGTWRTVRAPWGRTDAECVEALIAAFDKA